jgi:GNAT superfamily N-acetyltransferase
MKIKLRQAKPEDLNFIYSTWLLGLYHGNDWFNDIPKQIFFDNYKKVVEHRLMTSSVTVACLGDDDDVVLGYCVHRENTLDWIFVKKAWRRLGIAKSLLPIDVVQCTHLTKLGKKLKPEHIVFNPFI